MNINFELYKVFYEVANQKSISKGADKLLISQPAVTQAIKTLENELGGELFIRTPKGVILTHEGEELYNYIKEGMNYFINGTNKFTSLKNLEEGVINIGASATICEHFLMPYIKIFHEAYPKIEIKIINDLTDNLIKDLRNGSLDIIVSAIPSYKINDIYYEPILELNDCLVGGNKYAQKTYKGIKEVLKEDIILPKKPSVTRLNFEEFLKNKKLDCNLKMEVVSQNLLAKLAENNLGIALLPKEFIKDKLDKTLFEIKTELKIPKRKLGYALKNKREPSFTVRKFIEILKS